MSNRQRLDQSCRSVRTKLESARDSKCLPHPPIFSTYTTHAQYAGYARSSHVDFLAAGHVWPVRAIDRRLSIASRRERPRIRYEQYGDLFISVQLGCPCYISQLTRKDEEIFLPQGSDPGNPEAGKVGTG